MVVLISFILILGSVSNAEDIQWTDLGADHLWSTPDNWDLGRVPTLADEVRIDVPAAAAPNGPVIQDGIDAKAKGIFTEAAGEPTLTITGGTLEVAEWIWLGDGADSFGIWDMSGGTVTVANEFELGWGGGAGTLTMTGGTISAGEAVIPTGSGALGKLYLYGGTYNVTSAGGLSVKENGMIDITKGTLVLEGDDTAKINDLIAAGQITAYGSSGLFSLDHDQRNPGKTTLTAVERVLLFAEDFEGLELGPNVDEELVGEQVWTDTPPEGWTVDESGIPGIGVPATDGVTEWAGWAFADKAWWIEAAGDQDRSLFELASGTVAVADPDEWDDADRLPIPISADPYDTWLTTPAIDIFGLEAGTLKLTFDSSWRPEFDDNYHQTATITASFDGGEPVEVLRWESDEASENYKPYATNETVVVDLDVPQDASSVVLEFGLFDAGNDWWWAIDNVEVRGIPREKIVVLSEDFEGLPLGPNVDEVVAGDAVWTDTPPEGWAIDESGIPGIGDPATDGVTEWAGWAFADKAWWTEAAEDQNRSQFVLASGTVAVADPDEWDDADHPEPNSDNPYDTWLSTSAIDISGLEAGTLRLKFDSSWRPEFDSDYHQTANITASFDGGEPVEVLLWESDSGSANFKPDSTNETVVVDLQNPAGAKSVVLTFGLFDAGNDWWWAIDNVEVSGLAPTVDSSLVIYYSFDEVGDIVADQSGKGHDGVVVGEVTAEANGMYGGAANFANGGYLDLDGPSIPAEDIPTSAMTLAAWINMANTGGDHEIFNARASDETWVIHPEPKSSGDIRWLLRSYGGATIFQIRAGTITWDEWLHFAGTYDKESGKAALYINGELIEELVVENPVDIAGDWGMGARVGLTIDNGRPFTGLMDEFRMYTRALSQDDVMAIIQGP